MLLCTSEAAEGAEEADEMAEGEVGGVELDGNAWADLSKVESPCGLWLEGSGGAEWGRWVGEVGGGDQF